MKWKESNKPIQRRSYFRAHKEERNELMERRYESLFDLFPSFSLSLSLIQQSNGSSSNNNNNNSPEMAVYRLKSQVATKIKVA